MTRCARLTRRDYPTVSTPRYSYFLFLIPHLRSSFFRGSTFNSCCFFKANRAAEVEFFAPSALGVVDPPKRSLNAAAALLPPPVPGPDSNSSSADSASASSRSSRSSTLDPNIEGADLPDLDPTLECEAEYLPVGEEDESRASRSCFRYRGPGGWVGLSFGWR
jgi:hypothetical protein